MEKSRPRNQHFKLIKENNLICIFKVQLKHPVLNYEVLSPPLSFVQCTDFLMIMSKPKGPFSTAHVHRMCLVIEFPKHN